MSILKYDLNNGEISSTGDDILSSTKYVKDILYLFENPNISDEQKKEVIYYVSVHNEEGIKEGALQFGTSNINPGNINGEFYKTKGHTHELKNRAEYYFGLQGKGLLLLIDENDNVEVQEVKRNSLHYIKGSVAHRLVNISDEVLRVGACWNSDAGHDYSKSQSDDFGVRVFKANTKLGYEIKEDKITKNNSTKETENN